MSRRIALAALLGLIALQVAWYGWLQPPVLLTPRFVLALTVLPLAIPAAFALRGSDRALFIASLIGLLHFSHGVSEAWTTPAVRALALAEVALSALLAGTVAWQGLQQRRAARQARSATE